MRHGEVRVSNIELRLLPPPPPGKQSAAATAAAVPGLLTGNLVYSTGDRQVVFDLTGAALPLESVERIQTPKLPIGGRLSFQLAGKGSLLSPDVQGSLRLVDLRLGSETIGSFQGNLNSDGKNVTLMVDSAMSTGSLHGKTQVTLGGRLRSHFGI